MRRRREGGGVRISRGHSTGKVIQVVVEEDRATRVPLKQAMTHREQVRGAGSSGDTCRR